MRRLLRAGVSAAFLQTLAVVATTSTLFILVRLDLIPHNASAPAIILIGQKAALVTTLYLASALGIAVTRTQTIDETAAQIKLASARMDRRSPKEAAQRLQALCVIAALGSIPVAFHDAPSLTKCVARSMGAEELHALVWSSVVSTFLAGFGATAQASAAARN